MTDPVMRVDLPFIWNTRELQVSGDNERIKVLLPQSLTMIHVIRDIEACHQPPCSLINVCHLLIKARTEFLLIPGRVKSLKKLLERPFIFGKSRIRTPVVLEVNL